MKRTKRGYKLATALLAFAGSLYGGVDLIVDSINLSTDPVAPGDAVPITVTISNAGDIDVPGGTDIAVELTSTLTNAGSLNMSSFSGLAAGATTTVDFSFTIDEADLNGSYPISIEVDPANTVVEDSDANNGPTVQGTLIVEAFANLVPDAIDIGAGPFYPGETISVEVQYSNSGNRGTQAGFDITANLTAPNTGTNSTVTTTVAALATGGSGTAILSLPIDLDNPNGTYEIEISMDSGGAIDEGDGEGDNTDLTTFEINTKPDLKITDVSFETGAWEAGDIVDFSLSYHNAPSAVGAGTVRVGPNEFPDGYQIEVVLSTDDVFGNDDDFLLYLRHFSGNPSTGGNLLPDDPAGAGFVGPQEITLSWSQALPANFFGDYFVLAKIDTNETVEEAIEADNSDNGNNVWYPTEAAKITLVPSENAQAITYRGSVASDGTEGDAMSEKPALSADGRYLVFSSLSALVEEDTDAYFDIYRRDNLTGEVTLVSKPLAIETLSDGDSQYPAVSGDGRYVVYQSAAANLVAGDNNGHIDIFVTDTATGLTKLVSRDASGGFANGGSAQPSISADGGVVVYQSMATDLVVGGTTAGTLRVFTYDTVAETTSLLSGSGADGDSFEAKVSGDGAYAAFTSEATNLVGGVTLQQVYRVEIGSGTLLLVSTTGAAEGNEESFNPSINEDGSVVAYATLATNIDVPGGWVDQNLPEIIVADIAGSAVTPTRLLTAAGAQFNDASTETPVTVGAVSPVLSADGSRVVFRTQSTNILPTTKTRSDGDLYDEGVDGVAVGYTDLNSYNTARAAVSDVYLYDRDTDVYQIASLNTFGFQGAYLYVNIGDATDGLPSLPASRDGVISADGRFVAFSSDGRGYTGFDHLRTNRLSSDANEVRDVFVRDLRTGAEVVETNPPTISVVAPTDGATATEGDLIPLMVTATDVAPGYVETVYITVNGTVVATLTEADYQFGWVPDLPGSFEIGALAVDNDGIITVATPVTVTVDPAGAPTASISFPADGQQAWAGKALTISAQASDADGRVVQVEFFANGISLGVDANAPYALSWTPAGTGLHDLMVVATDNTGKLGYSSANRVTVVDASVPLVNIASPVSGSNVSTGETVAFATEVSGSSASITQVEYFVNGSSIGLATSQAGVWKIDYTPSGMGSLNVQAIATDASSNLYGSSVATYGLVAGATPTVSLVSPDPTDADVNDLADNDLAVGVPLTISAMAADSDGSISSVEFYVNGLSVGFGSEKSTVGLYEVSYTPSLIGVISIEVVARDDQGNATVTSLDYNVVSGTAPSVTIVSPNPTDADVDLEADAALTLNKAVVFSVNASDTDGSVASVEFFVDGASVGNATERTSIGVYELDVTPSLKGTFTFTALATDDLGNTSTVSLDYTVSEGAAPTATIAAPASGSALPVGEVATFAVEAADADGSIVSVELYVNGVGIGAGSERTTLGTYEVDYTPGALGAITVVAEATDEVGNVTTTSESYTVVAGAAPIVALISPDPTDGDADDLADNALSYSVPVTLAASASDTDGSIVSVRFLVNGVDVGAGSQSTIGVYQISYTPAILGVNTITAMATDEDGNETSVSLDYNVVTGAAPIIALASPDPSDADSNFEADVPLQRNEAVVLSVQASDPDGSIASVEFFINGVSQGFASERTYYGTYEIDFTPTLLGSFRFGAVATDDMGNQSIASLDYLVAEGAAPTVSIVGPDPTDAEPDGVADNALRLNESVTFQVDASDADGAVESVLFYLNGELLGAASETTTIGTYAYAFTPSVLGDHFFEAVVTDDTGNATTASLIYNVVSGAAPVLTVLTPDPLDGDSDGIADEVLLVQNEFTFSVEATDADGSVVQVEVFENGVFQGYARERTDISTFEFDFLPFTTGPRVLRAVATDDLGNTSEVAVTYFVSAGNAPTVAVIDPDPTDADTDGTADAALLAGQEYTFRFSAFDIDGSVASVQARLNGATVSGLTEVATGIFAVDYLPTTPGVLDLELIAVDDASNETALTQRYAVVSGTAPTLSFVSPDPTDADSDGTADAPLPFEETVTFAVQATDADGTIAEVRFYRLGSFLGNGTLVDASGVYEVSYYTSVRGTIAVDVEVEDSSGNITTGSLAYEIVDGVGLPTVSFVSPSVADLDANGVVDAPLRIGDEVEFLLDVADSDGVSSASISINGVSRSMSMVEAGRWAATFTPDRLGLVEVIVSAMDVLGNRTVETYRFSVEPVLVGSAPIVDILSPPDGGSYLPGTQLTLFASAYDPDGVVEEVQYFLNGYLVGSAGPPFETSIDLPAVPEGIVPAPVFTLEAVAIDNDGNSSAVDSVDFTIGAPDANTPRVIMTHPLPLGNGDVVNDASIASTTWLNAEIIDPNGTAPEDLTVEFFANGQLIDASPRRVGNTFAVRSELFFNSVGNYSFFARATDPEGHIGLSAPILLTVGNLEAPMPTAEVLPVYGDRSVLQPIPLYAKVDPGLVNLDRVDFFVNGVLVGSVDQSVVTNGTQQLFSFEWTPEEDILGGAASTTVEVTARAVQIDPNGQVMDNWKISDPVAVSLKEKLFDAPIASIDLISPVDGADYDLGTQIPLIADITTSGAGTALQVDFYANGEIIGSASSAPFRVYWSPSVAGSYAISAVLAEVGNVVLASAPPLRVDIDGGSSAPHFTYVGPALYGEDPTDPPTYPTVTAGSDVQIIADVAMMRDDGTGTFVPGEGNIEEVRFFINGIELGVDDTQPFTAFWTPTSAGTYQIEAEAVDNAGRLRLYSQQFNLADRTLAVVNPIGQAPTLSLGVTASGNVTPGSRVVVQGNVYDDDPDGIAVTFFLNGNQIGEPDTKAPFSAIIEPAIGVPPNMYTISGLATDSDGNSRAVTLSPLYIADVSVDHPSVEVITPGSGAVLTQGSRASLRANIVGSVDNIAQVIFYANGVRIGSAGSAPYSIDWLPDQLGEVEITAAVLQNTAQYDHDDNSFTPFIAVTPVMVATPVNVVVNPPVGVLPSVSFQILPTKSDLAQGSQVMLYADAQDLDGSIASVEFFLDGVSLGAADTTAPFSLLWTARREGQFYVNAVATDNEGNVVNSNFEAVTISPTVVSKTPSIDLTLPTTASQAGDFITLRSSVRDFVNGPEGVIFYIDGQPVGTAFTKPFNYIWEANLEGTISVFATARQKRLDGSYVTTASAAQSMTLAADEDPTVDFAVTWPGKSAAKPNPLVNETLTFTITATDNGRVSRIELVRNGETVKTLDVSSTTTIVEETPPSTGLYTYSVVVTDNAGRQTASAGTEVNVVTGAPPEVAITQPLAGDEYLPSDTITVRASASDSDGTVVGVQFYVNGVATGAVETAAPYELIFSPGTTGAMVLTARAEDNSGNFSALSDPVTVTVLVDEPAEFTHFDVNVDYGTGTSEDPYIVRVGQGFSIATEADDGQGLTSVILSRSGVAVTPPAGTGVPTQFFDELATPGRYYYTAEATDSGGNITTSERLYVKAIQGSKPTVSFLTPSDNARVEVGGSVPVRVEAAPGAESEGPVGTVARIEFRANGTQFAVRTSPPYTAGFTPASQGQWEISVVATSDTGVNSEEVIITLDAIDENLPDIVSFTNDAVGNQSLFGIPITFDVVATDETGVRKVEFFRVADTDVKVGEVLSEPFSFAYTPYPLDGGALEDDRIAAGTHGYYARVVNSAGFYVDSDPVEINIRYPKPLDNIEDYVFQTYLDLLLRVPTSDERNAAVSKFDSGELPVDQDAATALVLNVLEGDEYVAVRSAMLAYFLLTGEWPDRHELESGTRLITQTGGGSFTLLDNDQRAVAVKELVRLLLPVYETTYGNSLPTSASPFSEIEAFLGSLWEAKYGVPLGDPTVARQRFLAYGRDEFIARFILDVGNIVTPSGNVFSPLMGFRDPPNDRLLVWSDAAAMYLNLLREVPDQGAVEELATRLPAAQVQDTLGDARYAERFAVGDMELIHLADSWKESSWLGYYYDGGQGWNYHLELGWVYFEMENEAEDRFWYYDMGTGWSFTNAQRNPYVYSSKMGTWMFRYAAPLSETDGQRWFFNFKEDSWKTY